MARLDGPAEGKAVAAVIATTADSVMVAPTATRRFLRRATRTSPIATMVADTDFTAGCPPKERRLGSALILSRDGTQGQER